MIRAVLIDLSGTLHIENQAIPGCVEALRSLREKDLYVKFVTNTTKESRRVLFERLQSLGFDIKKDDILSSLTAARNLIVDSKLKPMLMLEPEALEDFEGLACPPTEMPNAVVVGLAPSEFHYDRLNEAFRYLQNGAQLIAIHAGKYYKRPDGLALGPGCFVKGYLQNGAQLIAIHAGKYYKRPDGLALGPGCFVKGLEYSAQCTAEVVGKPNKSFFLSALGDNYKPEEAVMIGDDVTDDIQGAMSAGLSGYLVQTGKYKPGDETKISPYPTATVPSFVQAVEKIITQM